MGADLAVQLLIAALSHAQELGTLIQTARAQGRDISDAELAAAAGGYDAVRTQLLADIAKASATG